MTTAKEGSAAAKAAQQQDQVRPRPPLTFAPRSRSFGLRLRRCGDFPLLSVLRGGMVGRGRRRSAHHDDDLPPRGSGVMIAVVTQRA